MSSDREVDLSDLHHSIKKKIKKRASKKSSAWTLGGVLRGTALAFVIVSTGYLGWQFFQERNALRAAHTEIQKQHQGVTGALQRLRGILPTPPGAPATAATSTAPASSLKK
jgi:hypothetical protein